MMKYVEVQRFGGPEVLVLIQQPDLTAAPGEGMVQVQVKAAGVNFADIMARSGTYPLISETPYRPGIEIAGVVTKVGAGVRGLVEGDTVAGLTFAGGGYSSQVVIAEQALFKMPPSLDFAIAAGLVVQGMTAYFLVEESRLQPGEFALINGAAGGMGSLAVQIAAKRGAKVLGLASASKHQRVRDNGAVQAFSYDAPGWSDKILAYTDGHGADIFIDSQGNLGGEGFKALARGARWILHGWMEESPKPFPADLLKPLIFKNVSIRGYSADWSAPHFPRAMKQLLDWVGDGSIKIDVTRYALEDAAKAHADIASRSTTGKVVLIP